MITVIDIQIGNIGSVSRALKFLKVQHKITSQIDDIQSAKKIIFPGVGSFAAASEKLEKSGITNTLTKKVLEEKIPILGICVGMQIMAKEGHEFGVNPGLGFINGKVLKIRSGENGFRLPHMGWNSLSSNNIKLLKDNKPEACFYFVHSYEMILDESIKVAKCNYGVDIVAAFEKDNIWGVQFHPEKSQEEGLKILKNFIEL